MTCLCKAFVRTKGSFICYVSGGGKSYAQDKRPRVRVLSGVYVLSCHGPLVPGVGTGTNNIQVFSSDFIIGIKEGWKQGQIGYPVLANNDI